MHVRKTCTFDGRLQAGKQEEVRRSLCDTNREQIFRLPNHRRRWFAPCLSECPIPPQSILASVADLVHVLLAVSRSFLYFCLSMTASNVAQTQSFRSFRERLAPFVNTFPAHGFPPVHLHQHFTRLRCSFPQFVAEVDVCTLLHCAMTLPLTMTTYNWPQSVDTAGHMQSMLFVDSSHVFEEPCACVHTCAKLPFK